MTKIKVGIIGLGNVGKKHYLEYLKIKKYDVVVICDFDKKIRYLKKNFGHPKF